ncbi:MAG: hypothetical protein N3E49_05330 [Bacteroidia bacterium]|nr:hypothetical protein [Bacteroidia bacterium]
MAGCSGVLIGLIWVQVKPTIHYLPQVSSRPLVWAALAWRHPFSLWEVGEVLTLYLNQEAQHSPLAARAESLGIQLYPWSGPDGAALSLTAPRSHLVAAVDWLYNLLSRLPREPNADWQAALRRYRKRWEGFSLERDLFWRLCGSGSAPGQITWEQAAAYIQRCFVSGNLHLIVGGNPSFREKVQLSRLHPPVQSISSTDTLTSSPSLASSDTTEENLWAYPAYVSLRIELPARWEDKLAFLQAFLTRWQKEAPPLQWRGRFWGKETYVLQARVDGRSFRFLRELKVLAPRDSAEQSSWEAAYQLARQRILAHPQAHLDLWMTATLQGDSVTFSDAVLSWRWSFKAQGIWLQNEWLAVDTPLAEIDTPSAEAALSESISLTNSSSVAVDYLWLGKGMLPLAEWASALQLSWTNRPSRPCELIGYYRHRQARNKRLRDLHALRRLLIRRYGIPPEAIRITLRPVPPDLPPKSLRLKCCAC